MKYTPRLNEDDLLQIRKLEADFKRVDMEFPIPPEKLKSKRRAQMGWVAAFILPLVAIAILTAFA